MSTSKKEHSHEEQLRAYQQLVDQDRKDEPAFRTRNIDAFNKACAMKKSGLVLREIRESDTGHCMVCQYEWTDNEVQRFLADGSLPRGLDTIEDVACTPMWIFDARGGKNPRSRVVEINPGVTLDMKACPAMCVFEVGIADRQMMIPSGELDVLPMEAGKVKFTIKDPHAGWEIAGSGEDIVEKVVRRS